MYDYICLCLPSNNVFRFNNGKTKMRQYFGLTMEKQEWGRRNDIPEWWWWWRPKNQNVFVVVVVVAAAETERLHGGGGCGKRERPRERQWNGDNERGMVRMWEECNGTEMDWETERRELERNRERESENERRKNPINKGYECGC